MNHKKKFILRWKNMFSSLNEENYIDKKTVDQNGVHDFVFWAAGQQVPVSSRLFTWIQEGLLLHMKMQM